MVTVGVRELKEKTSKLLRQVREDGEIIEITYRGDTIARVVPVNKPAPPVQDGSTLWVDLDQLAAEIGAAWPENVSATQAVREGRRDL